MSVTTRTNLATNPTAASTTNYAALAGTGGTAALTNRTDGGAYGSTYNRVTWSAATTAVSGGATYTEPSGIAASTAYAIQVWVRSSVAQTVQLKADFRNSSNTIVNTVTGSSVALTAGTWTQITVTGTSGAAVTNVVLTAQAVTGGVNWASGNTLDIDAVLPEAGTSTVGSYFDGSLTNAGGVVYAWTGTANASTSTAKTYVPYITLSTGTSPSPNVVVTYQDFDPGTNVINVWRTVNGVRRAVRNARRRTVVGSDFVTDYEAPLGVQASYDIEVLSGVSAGTAVATATTTITGQASGWLSDPLAPSSAVPVYGDVGPNGEAGLDFDSFAEFDYVAPVTQLYVLGSTEPVAFIGQRAEASNVAVSVSTLALTQAASLRALVKSAAVVLFRPLPGWASALPALCYLAAPTVKELPQNEKFGGQIISWQFGPAAVVAPPTAPAVVPTTSYGTVAGNYSTYAAFNAAHTGTTYLDVVKNP